MQKGRHRLLEKERIPYRDSFYTTIILFISCDTSQSNGFSDFDAEVVIALFSFDRIFCDILILIDI